MEPRVDAAGRPIVTLIAKCYPAKVLGDRERVLRCAPWPNAQPHVSVHQRSGCTRVQLSGRVLEHTELVSVFGGTCLQAPPSRTPGNGRRSFFLSRWCRWACQHDGVAPAPSACSPPTRRCSYIVQRLEPLTHAPGGYVAVWLHTRATYWSNCPSLAWMWRAWER